MRLYIAPALAMLGAACTAFTPVAVTPSLQSNPVRVQLNDQGTVGLASLLGLAPAELEGEVESVTDSVLVLSVSQVTAVSGVAQTWNGERASIPLRDVSSVALRRTSVARSVLLTGVLAGGVYLIGRSFGRGNATGSQTSYGGGVK